ncbi:hypothetical protein L9F63_019654, partial [Diploptera punctata]
NFLSTEKGRKKQFPDRHRCFEEFQSSSISCFRSFERRSFPKRCFSDHAVAAHAHQATRNRRFHEGITSSNHPPSCGRPKNLQT